MPSATRVQENKRQQRMRQRAAAGAGAEEEPEEENGIVHRIVEVAQKLYATLQENRAQYQARLEQVQALSASSGRECHVM